MTPETARAAAESAHVPVLAAEAVAALSPHDGGLYVDGTFGAGGYARRLLEAANCRVIGIDRDPAALAAAQVWAPLYGDRLRLVSGNFGELDTLLAPDERPDGIVLDIGVSSMQIDQAERGFSFLRDGPLDMRMDRDGPSAADIANGAEEAALSDIFFQYGEERRARAVARAVVAARAEGRIETTARLAEIIASTLPRKRPGEAHPATRVFQALRIAVNDELGALARGLAAAERALTAPRGRIAVVSFHSLEDRIVKRYFQSREAEAGAGVSRHAPVAPDTPQPSLKPVLRKPVRPGAAELEANPRARSATLRAAERTDAPPHGDVFKGLGLPALALRTLGS